VLLGSISISNPSAGSVKVNAILAIKHEQYAVGINDVALLKLPNPVTLTGNGTP